MRGALYFDEQADLDAFSGHGYYLDGGELILSTTRQGAETTLSLNVEVTGDNGTLQFSMRDRLVAQVGRDTSLIVSRNGRPFEQLPLEGGLSATRTYQLPSGRHLIEWTIYCDSIFCQFFGVEVAFDNMIIAEAGLCNADELACVCANEWTGENCDVCPPPFDGENCNECANPRFTGAMCDRCAPQYVGGNCDQCADARYAGETAINVLIHVLQEKVATNASMTDLQAQIVTGVLMRFAGANCDQRADGRFVGANQTNVPKASPALGVINA